MQFDDEYSREMNTSFVTDVQKRYILLMKEKLKLGLPLSAPEKQVMRHYAEVS